jgi:hypothetical protein
MILSFALPANWADWSSFFQIIQFIIVLIALVIAAKQFREASRARELTATNFLIELVGNESIRDIRSWFLHEFDNKESPTSEELEKIRKLAVCYDRVGFMIKQKMLPEKALYVWQRDEIKKLWAEITPFVNMIRTTYNRPNYCLHFEYLATEWIKKMER